MLKRLLLLGLLCAAFLLLMGLMVFSTADKLPPPRTPGVETAYLPVKAGLDIYGDILAPSHSAFRLMAPIVPLTNNTSAAFILPRCGRPYFQIFYHAFHFSDRAG